MSSLFNQLFILLLSFSSSLGCVAKIRTKWLSLNDEPCIVRATPINLNLAELKHYPFMFSLDKCSDLLSPKICVPEKTHKRHKY